MPEPKLTRLWYVANQAIETPTVAYATTPLVTTVLSGDNYLERVRWRFPPGCAQALGVAFFHGTTQIQPWGGQGSYVVGDDEVQEVPIGANVFGAFQLHTLNTGAWPHTIVVTIIYQPISVRHALMQSSLPELDVFTPAENPFVGDTAGQLMPELSEV